MSQLSQTTGMYNTMEDNATKKTTADSQRANLFVCAGGRVYPNVSDDHLFRRSFRDAYALIDTPDSVDPSLGGLHSIRNSVIYQHPFIRPPTIPELELLSTTVEVAENQLFTEYYKLAAIAEAYGREHEWVIRLGVHQDGSEPFVSGDTNIEAVTLWIHYEQNDHGKDCWAGMKTVRFKPTTTPDLVRSSDGFDSSDSSSDDTKHDGSERQAKRRKGLLCQQPPTIKKSPHLSALLRARRPKKVRKSIAVASKHAIGDLEKYGKEDEAAEMEKEESLMEVGASPEDDMLSKFMMNSRLEDTAME